MVRILEKRNVQGVIVRVDLADRLWNAMTAERLNREVESTRERQEIRRYTKGIPFLYNKFQAQEPSIRNMLGLQRAYLGRENDPADEEQAVTMWKANHTWWEGMVRESSMREIPLVFMLVDLTNASGYAKLKEFLDEMIGGYGDVYVIRLMSQDFGLAQGLREKMEQEIHETLTLRRDPHANALQHRLVGTKLFAYLDNKGVVERLCQGRGEPRPVSAR
jgi:hypothetical protein